MSINYIRDRHIILTSDVLERDVFIDELHDLSDDDLSRLIAEADVTVQCLKEDHDQLDTDDEGRVHVRHKRNIWKDYRQAAMIEKKLRGVDTVDRFFDLVANRIGAGEDKALMAQARG